MPSKCFKTTTYSNTTFNNTVLSSDCDPITDTIYLAHLHLLHTYHMFVQNMTRELKIKMKDAMDNNDLEQLENLVDIIRAKQLDREFETELWYVIGWLKFYFAIHGH